MYGHRMQSAMALPVLCAALALAGCGGGTGGVAISSQATAATKQATTPRNTWRLVSNEKGRNGSTTNGKSD